MPLSRPTSAYDLLLGAVVSICAFAIADYLYGDLSGIALLRQSAHMFRSEVAPYALHTSALLPNIDHNFQRFPPEAGFRVRTGSRGTIIGPDLAENAQRTILFLGGSTTECNEVDEPNRFPFVVQDTLRKSGIDVRAINAGVRGHTTQDSLVAYLARPGFRDADVVVMMHNINDRIWLGNFDNYEFPEAPHGWTTWLRVRVHALKTLAAFWDAISYRSNMLFAVRSRFARFNPFNGETLTEGTVSVDASNTQEEIKKVDVFSKNLRAFISLVRSQGATPVMMTQPLGQYSEAQNMFNDQIRITGLREGALVIDIDGELPLERRSLFLTDDIHLNDDGSRFVGATISRTLKDNFFRSEPER